MEGERRGGLGFCSIGGGVQTTQTVDRAGGEAGKLGSTMPPGAGEEQRAALGDISLESLVTQ